jgi:hypothetical protein
MTILSFAAPIESALPAAQGMLTAAAAIMRPALVIGAGITLFMLFRPLFVGFWRTGTAHYTQPFQKRYRLASPGKRNQPEPAQSGVGIALFCVA